jgi:hypothetical protein
MGRLQAANTAGSRREIYAKGKRHPFAAFLFIPGDWDVLAGGDFVLTEGCTGGKSETNAIDTREVSFWNHTISGVDIGRKSMA